VQFVVNYEEGGENSILDGDAASEGYETEAVPTLPSPRRRNLSVESVCKYGARAGCWRLRRVFPQARRGWSASSTASQPATVSG
jgi:hypothetical protein